MAPTAYEDELRRAIHANPDDDGPRLVYADLLAERNDPRGEFIHLQLENSDDDERDLREKLLLTRFGDTWAREAGVGGGADVGWRRGFPYALIGTPSAIMSCRGVIQREPITELSIHNIAGNAGGMTHVAQWPELAQIRWLRLEGAGWNFTAPQLNPLWASDELEQLETLEIVGNLVDNDNAARLTDASWFPQLQRLALSRVHLASEITARMVERLPKLRALDIRNCRLGPDVAARIARLTSPLRHLWIDGCAINAAGANTLFNSRIMRSIEKLAIGSDQLQATVEQLASIGPRNLKTLNLFSDHLGPADAIAIATGPFDTLVELSLATNSIGSAGAEALAASSTLSGLATLYVTANLIGVAGIEALAHRTGLPRLTKLGAFATVHDEPWSETRERFAHDNALVLV
jgi:uncharacterized protein (TIGR02996 family)